MTVMATGEYVLEYTTQRVKVQVLDAVWMPPDSGFHGGCVGKTLGWRDAQGIYFSKDISRRADMKVI